MNTCPAMVDCQTMEHQLIIISRSLQTFGNCLQLRTRRNSSSFQGFSAGAVAVAPPIRKPRRGKIMVAYSSGDQPAVAETSFQMNLNEYIVSLKKPLGIRFAQTLSGRIFVDALAKQGLAEKTGLIMVGDVLNKVLIRNSAWDLNDFGRVMNEIENESGAITFVFERSVFPSKVQSLILESKLDSRFNHGRVALATWNNSSLSWPNDASEAGGGNVGFVMYAWRFLLPSGIKQLASFAREKLIGASGVASQGGEEPDETRENAAGESSLLDDCLFQVVATFNGEESDEVEWSHGSYNLNEFIAAQSRAAKDLVYNPRAGLQYTKMTEHVFVGSCLQSGADIKQLKQLGVTAILNLQTESEQRNWGIDSKSIAEAAEASNMLLTHCAIRDVDAVDLRIKLPLAVGTLYRLLRANHRVYVTCTSGLARAPACVIGYLHWIQDVLLQNAFEFVTNLHNCGPDRSAIVWASWDLIAMVEENNHEGPPTHAVQFVWNHGCKEGEEVSIVGDFKGSEWNEAIKAVHVSGPKHTVDLRLPQGKYQYKFIVGGQWRHSSSLPTEIDRWGNINNVITVGGRASTRPENFVYPTAKEPTSVKVIERLLTEEERFALAFAARKLAFSVCPLKFTPKT